MVGTQSISASNTYTEARARYVMGKVYEEITSMMLVGLITIERANLIRTQLLYLLDKQALTFFEFQFYRSTIQIGGLRYIVRADNTIVADDESGNIDFWTLHNTGVFVTLFLELNQSSPNIGAVQVQLEKWGCGNGRALSGTERVHNQYSSNGYGVKQSIFGTW
jgi:hypothetical protein